jgi:uncharacterized caspase-like protein
LGVDIIGNSAYQTAPLKNPFNDAQDIAATLRTPGFEVILKKMRTREQWKMPSVLSAGS